MYDLATKQLEAYVFVFPFDVGDADPFSRAVNRSVRLDGELTSVKISHDSQFALINRAPGPDGHTPCVSTNDMSLVV